MSGLMNASSLPGSVKPISVRLTTDQQDRLGALAGKLGSNQAMIIRWSVDALLDYVDACDGKLTLPVSYSVPASPAPTEPHKESPVIERAIVAAEGSKGTPAELQT